MASESSFDKITPPVGIKICFSWRDKGYCSNIGCLYDHSSPQKKKVCFSMRDQKFCRKGIECPFDHPVDARTKPLCLYFNSLTGCKKGDLCMYDHIVENNNINDCFPSSFSLQSSYPFKSDSLESDPPPPSFPPHLYPEQLNQLSYPFDFPMKIFL